MTYTQPQLNGYAAIAVIQATNKQGSSFESGTSGPKTTPAYEADE